ncbi:MAG TPA: amidohydrolase [Gaiellaceae bacterium]|nr:amidohydrolase [Gaiellaceae bacterium]
MSADLTLTGASLFGAGEADAVAVAGGRIAAVGSAREIAAFTGPGTRVLDLEGRTVVPGFQDAHLHPPSGGLAGLRCDLYGAQSREECLEAVAAYAAANPGLEWIAGGGWSIDSFPGGTPSRADLDAIVRDRPVFLENRDGHGAWVNSLALALAGIRPDTPDPPDGRIERDSGGEPQGTLHEGAIGLVERLLPATTQAEWEKAILRAQAELHALGITAWQDAAVYRETYPAYLALAERGALTMRMEGNLLWERGLDEADQLADLVERRVAEPVGRLRLRGAKIFADGVLENFTGALLDPYVGTDNRGISMHEPDELARIVAALDAHGFQVHLHTIGDRAVREALDAIEAARRANGPRDARHHLAHVQLVHADDLPRFAELGVAANVSTYWACRSDYVTVLTEPFIGPERSARMYPFASLVRAGARLACGSDWTVSTPDPLQQLEVAVTRVSPDTREAEPLLPEEALDLAAALTAFTAGSAWANGLEADTGTLEPGKLADLAVLDSDVLDPSAGPIGDARVLLTLVEGEAVHADPGLGW